MLRQWWSNELSPWVKFVFLVLLANALPAFIILMSVPHMTDLLFVWTIKAPISARLIGAMYGNALLLIVIGLFQPNWARVRVILVVITLFSVFATILTFFYLTPFLAHPWFHLAYWLTMYLILFVAAPIVFVAQERAHGGRLPVQVALRPAGRLVAAVSLLITLMAGLGLLFQIEIVNQIWPWTLPPLVGGLVGVLFVTHAAAYAWALWDGDWLRVRPIFWQAPITALLFMLLPLLHPEGLRPEATDGLALYYLIVAYAMLANTFVLLGHRHASRFEASHAGP